MKTIVIPAHGCESAVKLFKLSLQLYRNEAVAFWFLDIRNVPGNYNDLLTIGRAATPVCAFDMDFRNTIQALIGKNENISFHIDHIYGDSPYVFRNYLRFREANLVVYDKKEWQYSKKETGLNIFRMVRQCDCELMYVSGDNNELLSNSSDNDHNSGVGSEVYQLQPAYTKTPAGVQYQFQALDNRLADLNAQQQRMVSIRLNNLSRYFLKETALQKMMVQSGCSLLLLQK